MDFFLVVLFPAIAALLIYTLSLSFLLASFLFFGVPAIYLSFRKPQIVKKSLLFTVLIVSTVSWVLDHMAFLDKTWFVDESALRLLGGTIPIEDVIFGFFWAYYGVVFWECFLDHDKNKYRFDPRTRYLIVFLGVALSIFFALYFLDSPWLVQPYFYLKFGLTVLVPPILFAVLKFPRLIRRLAAIGIYFFFLSLVGEHIGLTLGHWRFPGNNYIATATQAGQLIPWEEIIFWWALGVPGLICWYE